MTQSVQDKGNTCGIEIVNAQGWVEAHWLKCGTVDEEVICWREIAFIPAHGACPLGSAMNKDEDQLAQHNADSVSFQMV